MTDLEKAHTLVAKMELPEPNEARFAGGYSADQLRDFAAQALVTAALSHPPQPVSQEVVEALEYLEQSIYSHDIRIVCTALRQYIKEPKP